jgi:hypothetical protein
MPSSFHWQSQGFVKGGRQKWVRRRQIWGEEKKNGKSFAN